MGSPGIPKHWQATYIMTHKTPRGQPTILNNCKLQRTGITWNPTNYWRVLCFIYFFDNYGCRDLQNFPIFVLSTRSEFENIGCNISDNHRTKTDNQLQLLSTSLSTLSSLSQQHGEILLLVYFKEKLKIYQLRRLLLWQCRKRMAWESASKALK